MNRRLTPLGALALRKGPQLARGQRDGSLRVRPCVSEKCRRSWYAPVTMQPTHGRWSDISVLPNEPAKILSAPAGFLSRENDVSRRHRRSWCEQINTGKWRFGKPMRGVEASHQPDDGDFTVAACQCESATDESLTEIEGWVTNNVIGARLILLKKIEEIRMRVTAIDNVGGTSVVAGTTCGFDDATETASGIPDTA
jgi:hypothetical protein